MAKAWQHSEASEPTPPRALDWRKRMSDNIAYALLVYTALQIFVTMGALHGSGGSILPYFALVLLVAAIIPACRRFEKRWDRLDATQAADPSLASYFRRDRLMLWIMAICLPLLVTGMFMLLAVLFG
ncbi:MAG TPA: hypothetical protein VHG29_13135 [Novosphingobium sp.]|nr:hypothetical protein [Novosphingobium sp.]